MSFMKINPLTTNLSDTGYYVASLLNLKEERHLRNKFQRKLMNIAVRQQQHMNFANRKGSWNVQLCMRNKFQLPAVMKAIAILVTACYKLGEHEESGDITRKAPAGR